MKRIISESTLKQIVKESVKKAIEEGQFSMTNGTEYLWAFNFMKNTNNGKIESLGKYTDSFTENYDGDQVFGTKEEAIQDGLEFIKNNPPEDDDDEKTPWIDERLIFLVYYLIPRKGGEIEIVHKSLVKDGIETQIILQ